MFLNEENKNMLPELIEILKSSGAIRDPLKLVAHWNKQKNIKKLIRKEWIVVLLLYSVRLGPWNPNYLESHFWRFFFFYILFYFIFYFKGNYTYHPKLWGCILTTLNYYLWHTLHPTVNLPVNFDGNLAHVQVTWLLSALHPIKRQNCPSLLKHPIKRPSRVILSSSQTHLSLPLSV